MGRPVAINETSLMLKPVGPKCNLRCSYCYYLPTHQLFEQPIHTLSDAHLEAAFAGCIPQGPAEVMINWQGGEPTLAGLDFFRRAVALQKRYARPGQRVANTLQTNGTLLDPEWCQFLKDEGFLIGISIDGRRRHHDAYRVDAKGQGAFDKAKRGLELLKQHGVDFNILCVLQQENVRQPAQVWQGLLETGASWFQFIPAIEWVEDKRRPGHYRLAPFSPSGEDYGRFLCWIFDEWFATCRDRISIRHFDSILNGLLSGHAGECTLADACSGQLTLEHDGSVYGCDHFVQPAWKLGEITADTQWMQGLRGERLQAFSDRKSTLCQPCQDCRYKALCWGGCPKHRGKTGGELAPSVLCTGYIQLLDHALPRLEWLASFLRRGQQPPPLGFAPPPGPMRSSAPKVGKNEVCPCGSGKKYKHCHGRGT